MTWLLFIIIIVALLIIDSVATNICNTIHSIYKMKYLKELKTKEENK